MVNGTSAVTHDLELDAEDEARCNELIAEVTDPAVRSGSSGHLCRQRCWWP